MKMVGQNPEGFGFILTASENELAALMGVQGGLPAICKTPGTYLDTTKELNDLRKELSKLYATPSVKQAMDDRSVCEHAYKNVLKLLEGFKKSSRDNTLSAHAVICDIIARVHSEIDFPTM